MNTFLGIDFGTTNSFCCVAQNGLGPVSPQAIHLHAHGGDTFPTVLLYEADPEGGWKDAGGGWKVVAFGREAEDEWQQLLPSARERFRFVANFKPDLAKSEVARAHAKAFLTCLVERLNDEKILHGFARQCATSVALGIPATILPGHDVLTIRLAKEAGWANVEVISEPKSALAYHLHTGGVPLDDRKSSVLVIDFGGGTCDFALLQRGECVHAWGDPLYGGRLFDDLIFQWFCAQNPAARVLMETEHTEPVIHWSRCRAAKEAFSLWLRKPRGHSAFTYNGFDGYGALRTVTRDEFEQRAHCFEPSLEMREYWERCGVDWHQHFGGRPISLIDHFANMLASGLNEMSLRPDQVSVVILTGGGSLWYFVRETLIQRLGFPESVICQSGQPQATIGYGAALVPVLKLQLTDRQQQLRQQKAAKADELAHQVMELVDQFTINLAKDLSDELVNNCLLPRITLLQETDVSWTLAQARQWISQDVETFRPQMQQIVQDRESLFAAQVSAQIDAFLQAWLAGCSIRWQSRQLPIAGKGLQLPAVVFAVAGPIQRAIEAIVAVVTSVVAANILGGAGMALLLAGPYGLLFGFLIGTLLAAGLIFGGQKAAEHIPIPAWIRRSIFTKSVVDRFRNKTQAELQQRLKPALAQQRDAITNEVGKIVDGVIVDLNWINAF
jgi:hypothetical protein